MYGLSSSGWIDSEIFDAWFHNHFLTYTPASRPLLLLLDGPSSHYNPATIRRAAEEKVILFCLSPNTTHKTQPLDRGVLVLSRHTGGRNATITLQQIEETFSFFRVIWGDLEEWDENEEHH